MIREHRDDPRLCYHSCPTCGREIEEPFLRGGPPIAFTHHKSRRRNCRIIVRPGVSTVAVRPDMRFETALAFAADRAA